MQDTAQELKAVVEAAAAEMLKLSEADSERRVVEGKWSKKEIIGHLIDSASNNHQRFVRVQFSDGLTMPGYEQNRWVESQSYQTRQWAELVTFWRSYNLHLAHVIAHVAEASLNHRVTIGSSEPVTLEFVIRDYLSHLKHHLGQILN
ncbi:MAG: DinB family protein [Blastocatellia bacterium]